MKYNQVGSLNGFKASLVEQIKGIACGVSDYHWSQIVVLPS